MNIQIEINLDNAAFQDNPEELAQILEKIPHDVKPGRVGTLTDSNGNTVGHWQVS